MSDIRKLASVQRIAEIQPIEGADKIVKARINGWWVVTAIDNGFNVGDLVVYLEIDSWVPTVVAPFLTKPGHHPKVYQNIEGERLRTIRLRKQLSQGMILPLQVVSNTLFNNTDGDLDLDINLLQEGDDVTAQLGIVQWEREVPANLAGLAKGSFPSFIRKTDAERCQNMLRDIFEKHKDDLYEITVKLDGSSITVYGNKNKDTGEIELGVCSRNLNLKLDQEGNSFVDTASNTGLLEAVRLYVEETGNSIAVQGELVGPGIQKNREQLVANEIYVYSVFDIDEQEYVDPLTREQIYLDLVSKGALVRHVPLFNLTMDRELKASNSRSTIEEWWEEQGEPLREVTQFVPTLFTLKSLGVSNIDELLALAVGPSINNTVREGLVFKSASTPGLIWKAISNEYLEQVKE